MHGSDPLFLLNIGEKISESCFSQLIAELTKLIKKDAKFHWPESAQKAFDNAKTRLSSEKCISFANFSLPFKLVTDASSVAMGAVLLQIINGKQKIIACISKTFNETEKRWSATERECYAILFAVEKLNYFIKGPTPFTLLTDHKSLTYLDRNVFSNAKISRWQSTGITNTILYSKLELRNSRITKNSIITKRRTNFVKNTFNGSHKQKFERKIALSRINGNYSKTKRGQNSQKNN